jgi:hypothetical protein
MQPHSTPSPIPSIRRKFILRKRRRLRVPEFPQSGDTMSFVRPFRSICIGILAAVLMPVEPSAQSHPGCADLKAGDFRVSTFTVGSRPISVDFLTNPDGTYDSYFAMMNGQIIKVDSKGARTTIATLPGESMTYAGMTAFQFHPDFAKNGWAFSSRLIKTPGWTGAANLGAFSVRLSRHKFDPAAGRLSEEKVLLDIPQIAVKDMGGSSSFNRALDNVGTYAYFQNGQMRFDRHGNLYLNMGADHRSHESYVFTHNPKYLSSSAEARAGNTRKLNGGILRIFPDDSPKGYSIPAGNFREYWEKRFQDQGNAEAAKEYALSAGKVAPEIYVKGTRTNWTLKTHRSKDWLAWGEVMVTGAYDEISIVKNPAFGGYPYFYGNNEKTFRYYIGHYDDKVVDESGYDRTQNASLNPASRADTNAPKNLSPLNDGAVNLPPAHNPQITSQRYQSRKGGVRLADVGLPYVSNGTPGSAQATADSWFEASAGEKSQTALPPVTSNLTRYQAIMAGDFYSFNRPLNDTKKFPPHFNDHLFIFDWEQNVADVAKVSDIGDRLVVDTVFSVKALLGLGSISKIIDGTFTPSGTLLVSSELGTIYRVEYAGSCVDIGPVSTRPESAASRDGRFALLPRGIEARDQGLIRISLHDVHGRFLEGREIRSAGYYEYARLFGRIATGSRYFVRASLASENGTLVRTAGFAAL